MGWALLAPLRCTIWLALVKTKMGAIIHLIAFQHRPATRLKSYPAQSLTCHLIQPIKAVPWPFVAICTSWAVAKSSLVGSLGFLSLTLSTIRCVTTIPHKMKFHVGALTYRMCVLFDSFEIPPPCLADSRIIAFSKQVSGLILNSFVTENVYK